MNATRMTGRDVPSLPVASGEIISMIECLRQVDRTVPGPPRCGLLSLNAVWTAAGLSFARLPGGRKPQGWRAGTSRRYLWREVESSQWLNAHNR